MTYYSILVNEIEVYLRFLNNYTKRNVLVVHGCENFNLRFYYFSVIVYFALYISTIFNCSISNNHILADVLTLSIKMGERNSSFLGSSSFFLSFLS